MTSTQLTTMMKDSGLEPTKSQYILDNFQNYFSIAAEWETKAKTIKVENGDQKADMQLARVGRLFLREKRIDIEKARKNLKEQSLREGKAIDGIANVLKSLIEPIEQYLDEQEHFVEIKQKQEEERLRLEAETKAEVDRIAKEKAEREEQERIRVENERLKKEAEAREKAIAEERAKAEAERKRIDEERRKEAEARERLEREAQVKKEAEERAMRENNEQKRKEEQEQKKLEAEKKYQEWLSANGWSAETSKQFHISNDGDVVYLYKLVSEYKK